MAQQDNPLDENNYPIYGTFKTQNNMKKQTAVEWLIERFAESDEIPFQYKHLEQAKEMEKQQIKDAWYNSRLNNNLLFEDYYNETYVK